MEVFILFSLRKIPLFPRWKTLHAVIADCAEFIAPEMLPGRQLGAPDLDFKLSKMGLINPECHTLTHAFTQA